MTTLKMFTLINGQEIIAERLEDLGDTFIIKRPMVFQAVPAGENNYGITMVPLSLANPEGTMALNTELCVLEHIDIPSDLAKAYTKQTSGIEIVSSLIGL